MSGSEGGQAQQCAWPTRRRRRTRTLGALVGIALVVVVGVTIAHVNHAVNELTLPLSDASVIREQAQAKQLDPALIAAVIYAETKFEPRTSSAGAEGLMQIEPETADSSRSSRAGIASRRAISERRR